MERSEAEQLRRRMVAEHPDRSTHSFILSEHDGDWAVAKVALPPTGAPTSMPGAASRAPLHDHEEGRLPGGLPNWTGGI